MHSLLDSYARNWRMSGKADTTLATYMNSLRLFVRDTLDSDDAALFDATRADLERYIERRMTEVSFNAASSDVRAFKSFYRWAYDQDEIDADPAKRLKHPKVDEPPVRVAVEDDLRKLLKTCKRTKLDKRDAAILAVLYHGGLRRSEICVLDYPEHLDLEGRWLTIPKTKSGRPRRVPLHTEAVGLIDRYLRLRGDHAGALFLPHRGERLLPNGVGQMIERRAKQADVDIRAHAFRRGLAVRYLANGGGEATLKAIVGWSPSGSQMVSRYVRMNVETLAGDEYHRLMG